MSASINPTRYPSLPSATARFTATVVFPTPPLPLPIATTCATPGNGCGPGGAPAPICPIILSSLNFVESCHSGPDHVEGEEPPHFASCATTTLCRSRLKHANHFPVKPVSPSSSASPQLASRAAVPHLQTVSSDVPSPAPP